MGILIILVLLIWALAVGVCTSCAVEPENNELVAAVLIAEAGGEGYQGLTAVYEVIRNRAEARNHTLERTVRQRFQFSCLNDTPEPDLIERARTHPRWREALHLARNGWQGNITRGANHYHRADMNPWPVWSRGEEPRARIGAHVFFRL
jgi:spore germination cell wall hydrolase CwlJ-like protein